MEIIAYKEEFGPVHFPEGFAEQLIGKPLAEQMTHFCIEETVFLTEMSYGEVTRAHHYSTRYQPEEYDECTAWVVKDDLIVGVMLRSYFDNCVVCCMPGQRVCTYSASDDDGAGSNERDDYACLICL